MRNTLLIFPEKLRHRAGVFRFSISSREGGQSLVEALIAIVIVSLVLISVVVAVLVAIKSAQFSKHKSQSAFLGQEAIEWLRNERRGLGWSQFADYAAYSPGVTYCLMSLELTNLGECDDSEVIDNLYKRLVVLTLDDDYPDTPEISVDVVVEWKEGEKDFSSPVSAVLARWDVTN